MIYEARSFNSGRPTMGDFQSLTYDLDNQVMIAAFLSEAKNDHDYDPEWDYMEDAKRYVDAIIRSLQSRQ